MPTTQFRWLRLPPLPMSAYPNAAAMLLPSPLIYLHEVRGTRGALSRGGRSWNRQLVRRHAYAGRCGGGCDHGRFRQLSFGEPPPKAVRCRRRHQSARPWHCGSASGAEAAQPNRRTSRAPYSNADSRIAPTPVVTWPLSFHRSTIVAHKVQSIANSAPHRARLADLLRSRPWEIL